MTTPAQPPSQPASMLFTKMEAELPSLSALCLCMGAMFAYFMLEDANLYMVLAQV